MMYWTDKNLVNTQIYMSINSMLLKDKLTLEDKKIISSKCNELVNINKSVDTYYYLFYVYIKIDNFKQALKYIKKVIENGHDELEIYNILLSKYLDNEKYIVPNVSNILGNYDIDRKILVMFNECINCINKNEYKEALKYLDNCYKISIKKKYEIDFIPLVYIINKFMLDYNKNVINTFKVCFFNSNNIGYDYHILKQILKLEPNNLDAISLIIEQLIILSSYEEANNYLKLYILNNGNMNANILYLQKVIDEVLSNKNNYIYDYKVMHRIEQSYSKGQIDEAIDICNESYQHTNNTDYIYMIAKILYQSNNFDKSLDIFKRYVKLGNVYIKESYCYMYFICNSNGLEGEDEYLQYLFNLICTDNYIDINVFKNILLSYKDNISKKGLMMLKKDIYKRGVNEIGKIKTLINNS